MIHNFAFCIIFAVAGGGGSSSGGSDSGGSDFDGSSGVSFGLGVIAVGAMAAVVIFLISGFFWKNRTKLRKFNRVLMGTATTFLGLLLGGIILLTTPFAGENTWIVALLAVIFTPIVCMSTLNDKAADGKIPQLNVSTAVTSEPPVAVNGSSAEDLQEYTKQIFLRYQSDWSQSNFEAMKVYLSSKYAAHMQLVLTVMKQINRQNVVKDPQTKVTIKPEHISQNQYNAHLESSATDVLIDASKLETLNEEEKEFIEDWTFVKEGGQWKLAAITQDTEESSKLIPEIKEFANQKNLFYSPDWGDLLIPTEGEIFKNSEFGFSDINNHVIGMHNNLIIQLYTFTNYPENEQAEDDVLIAQATLPKTYGHIIVEHRKSRLLHKRPPDNMQAISLEWAEFNSRYQVFAATIDQANSLELLHPVYMEKLFALPFDVSIEIVGNVLYLYAPTSTQNYPVMLSLLEDAFNEMKL